MNSKRVTLREVAERVGLSHVAISLALRNHPSIPRKRCQEIKRVGGNYMGGFYAAQKLFKLQHALTPLMTDERRYREQPAKARETLRQWLLKHQPDAVLTSVPQRIGG